MARKTVQWFFSFQLTLFLVLVFVRGQEDAEDAYKNGRHLVLEYFLPINLPAAVDVPLRREKRDVEGSGEDDSGFAELKENEDADNSTQNAVGKFVLQDKPEVASVEGSGEVEVSSEEDRSDATAAAIIGESEIFPTTLSDETTKIPEVITEDNLTSTEMIFDRSEDFDALSTSRTEETSTEEVESTPVVMFMNPETDKTATVESTTESRENESTTGVLQETTEEATTAPTEATTVPVAVEVTEAVESSAAEATTQPSNAVPEETTTAGSPTVIPVVIPEKVTPEVRETTPPNAEQKQSSSAPSTSVFIAPDVIPNATEGLPTVPKLTPTTPQPVVEEIFKEIKIDRKLEATPGKILQKENLSLGGDPLLIANTRLMDSEENVQLSSAEPKRLGAYIVIALILLSFLTLIGYITFKKRMNRKRQVFESNQESNDTEKALLSLSDYKDSTELEENHLKNNEITPIVVKSNSQINRFEKNTNFSSPKNLNTTANEKNIEKDNVLKSTAENLTQVIIEDSPKDVEEDKNASAMEKLIVKTRIDQDSIPKKPIIINRSSTGYLPIPQDNS